MMHLKREIIVHNRPEIMPSIQRMGYLGDMRMRRTEKFIMAENLSLPSRDDIQTNVSNFIPVII
jgi:hypothetical protein